MTMAQEILKLSSVKVKEEPPEDFVLFLSSPKPQPEDEGEPPTDVKKESPEDQTTNPMQQPAKNLSCTKCGYEFTSRHSLQKHISSGRFHDCLECDAKFPCRLLRDRHQSEFHGVLLKGDQFSVLTSNELLRLQQIEKRRVTKGIQKRFTCLTCKKSYSHINTLSYHLKEQRHGAFQTANQFVKTFACDICNKSFSNPNTLRRHQNAVHEESEAKCDVCGEIYKNRKSLHDHSRIHRHDKVECSICSKKVAKFLMVSHMRSHSAENLTLRRSLKANIERKLAVAVKGREDANIIELQGLLTAVVKEEPKEELILNLPQPAASTTTTRINTCAACDLQFSSLLMLVRHRIELHGTVFKCHKCSYRTRNRQILTKHQRIHQKSFSCKTCQKKFALNIAMKFHQKHHQHGIYAPSPGETLDCVNCNKSFPTPNALRRHQRVHDEKEVMCEVCGKICKNLMFLRHHRRAQVKVDCSICHKMISARSKASHLRSHCSEENLQTVVDDLAKSNQLRKMPQQEEGDYKFTQAQEEPSKQQKWWVKSVKVAKFDAKWRIKSTLYQTFLTSPKQNCKLSIASLHEHDHPNQLCSATLEQSSFELSLTRVLPQPPPHNEDSIDPEPEEEEEEEDIDPRCTQFNVKVEPPDGSVLTLLPTTSNQSQEVIPKGYQEELQKYSHSNPIHNCAICEFKFSSKPLLDRHQIEFHLFKCDECSYQTNFKYCMKRHYQKHNKSFNCDKKFSVPEETFACDKCNKTFSISARLKQHQLGVHDDNEVKCYICGQVFKNSTHLHQHHQTHFKIECSLCSKMVSKREMPRHKRIHSRAADLKLQTSN